MKKINLILVTVLLFSCLNGCKTTSTSRGEIKKNSPIVLRNANKAQNISDEILISSNAIERNISIIEKELPSLKEKTTEIRTDINNLRQQGVNVAQLSSELKIVAENISYLEKSTEEIRTEVIKLRQANKDLEEQKNILLTRSLHFLILIGTILVALGIFLFMTGNLKAIAGAVAGGVLIITSMAVTILTKLTWLFTALAGLGVTVLACLLGYHLYEYYKQKRGLIETVQTIEKIKPEMTKEIKEKAFGDDCSYGIAGTVQSTDTQKMIKNIKKRLLVKQQSSN